MNKNQIKIISSLISAPIIDFYEEIAASLSDDENRKPKKSVCHDYYCDNELKLQCCVLMLDVILKQVKFILKTEKRICLIQIQ